MMRARLRRRPSSAAEWFAARQGSADPTLERQFHAWLAEDASHGEEYALCEITWEVSQDAARQALVPRRPDEGRHRTMSRAALAAAAAAAAMAAVVWLWPPASQTYATVAGEQRTLVLDDGSHVTLNTRSRIVVRLARRARTVALQEGEAFFDVSKDASRPFTVSTALGSARAVGTRFDVHLDEGRLLVTTAEGRVFVKGIGSSEGENVDAGSRASLGQGTPGVVVEPANLGAELGWLSRRLEADDAPLGEVLQAFSRYTSLPVHAATPAIAALRVSAVLRTGDLDALQATLAGAFGLSLERHSNEWLVVDPKVHLMPAP
jgi:transmembrane sensor